jgi:hypothetical protein
MLAGRLGCTRSCCCGPQRAVSLSLPCVSICQPVTLPLLHFANHSPHPPPSYLLHLHAAFYRRERWEAPLASTLLLLRECRQQEHNLQVMSRSPAVLAFDAALAPRVPVLDLLWGDLPGL